MIKLCCPDASVIVTYGYENIIVHEINRLMITLFPLYQLVCHVMKCPCHMRNALNVHIRCDKQRRKYY